MIRKAICSNKFLSAVVVYSYMSTGIAIAEVHPQGASSKYAHKALSYNGNSAAAALIVERNDPHVVSGGSLNLGGGLEYGNLDDLFEKINTLANDFRVPSDGSSNGSGSDDVEHKGWDTIFEQYPDLEEQLSILGEKVVATSALLAVISNEGYGKAQFNADGSFIVNEDLFGGTLLFGFATQGSSKALGIVEQPNFDKEQAKIQLETISDFTDTDPIQALELSDGITLFYNPANNKTKLTLENDSLMLIKAAKVSQFSLSYSKKALTHKFGDLYWGVKPTYYRVGLANVGVRLGDITDSEALFDDIKNADFVYKNGADFDLGLIWAAEHYQIGASLNNVIENTFHFPELDRRQYSSSNILSQLDYQEHITLERQFKLEAGIYTKQRNWSLHAELDANSITDYMKDQYQWLTVTGGYAADNWWLPSARIGFSKNLTGSKLTYLNAGITFMKFLNLDIASTLDTVQIDDSDIMRGLSIRLGVQFDY